MGVDCVETNTFGANHTAAAEYEIADRVHELSEAVPASPARSPTSTPPATAVPAWVLGSVGPGTKLPTLGHVGYTTIRDGYQANAEGLLAGGADALIVETTQDLLQTKASVIAARGPWRSPVTTCP